MLRNLKNPRLLVHLVPPRLVNRTLVLAWLCVLSFQSGGEELIAFVLIDHGDC